MEHMRTHGFVCFALPLFKPDEAFQLSKLGLEVSELMIQEAKSDGKTNNRGEGRTCVNDKYNINLDPYFYLMQFIMEPGRWLFDLLQDLRQPGLGQQFEDIRIERCGGDVIAPGAPLGAGWHRDWDKQGYMLSASIFCEDIGLRDGPLIMATRAAQHAIIGKAGAVILRDVRVMHRGSVHNSKRPHAMPSFRFSTLAGRMRGGATGRMLHERMANRWPQHLQALIFRNERPRSNDHEGIDYMITSRPRSS